MVMVCGGASVLSECSAGAALIPLDDGEVLQPRPEPGVTPRIGRVARSAVQKEQHRIVSVLAADRDPLLDAADLDVPGFVDAVRRGDGVVARVPSAEERPCASSFWPSALAGGFCPADAAATHTRSRIGHTPAAPRLMICQPRILTLWVR